jgi:ABC-2 type transport system permease protein
MMKAVVALTKARLRLFVRDFQLMFWTLAFPSLMLVLFGELFVRRAPAGFFGGANYVDVFVPGLVGLAIGSLAVFTVGIETAEAREKGILRRFKATPLPPAALFLSTVAIAYLAVLVETAVLMGVARVLYGFRLYGNPLVIWLAITLATLAGLALGYILASLAPSGRTANAVGMAVLMPQMGLSGAIFPLDASSDTIRLVGRLMPLSYIVDFLQNAFTGRPAPDQIWNAVALLVFLVVGLLVSLRAFRWEP